jgi:phosphotransferase system IIA component
MTIEHLRANEGSTRSPMNHRVKELDVTQHAKCLESSEGTLI